MRETSDPLKHVRAARVSVNNNNTTSLQISEYQV